MSLIANDILPKLEDSKADIEAAIKGLDSAILTLSETSDRKGHFRAYELRAVLNVLNGDFKSAKTDCYKMSAILPDDESCKIIAGQIFTQTNEFDEADKLLEPLAEGRRRDVLQILAYSNHKLGNHDMASKYFTGYIEDSDSDQEWTAYLQSLWLSGERKKAYQAALNLRKAGRASVMIMRDVELKRLIEMEEWAAALDVLEDLVKAEPDNAEHYLNRLAMNMNLGRKEHILEVYEALPRQLIESDGWASTKLALMEKGLRNGKIPNLSS